MASALTGWLLTNGNARINRGKLRVGTRKIEGLVIGLVRHNERSNIATLYTRQEGRVVCVVPAPKARSRLPRLMLLSRVSADVRWRSTAELQQLHSYTVARTWPRIYSSPIKTTLVMFLSEFLGKALRESAPDDGMWRFINSSLEILEVADSWTTANFHIVFLALIADFLGISPDVSDYSPGKWFDLRSVRFTSVKPPHADIFTPDEARLIPVLIRLTYANARILRITGEERSAMVNAILRYFGIHLPGVDSLKSPSVLAEYFFMPNQK